MLAVGMALERTGVHAFELPMPEIKQPDEVLVRVKEVGLDGTDFNMLRYGLQDIAEGHNEMGQGRDGRPQAVKVKLTKTQAGDDSGNGGGDGGGSSG